jgi:hypothetical protein
MVMGHRLLKYGRHVRDDAVLFIARNVLLRRRPAHDDEDLPTCATSVSPARLTRGTPPTPKV